MASQYISKKTEREGRRPVPSDSKWTPIVMRGGKEYLEELSLRIKTVAKKRITSPQSRSEIEELEWIGDQIFQAQVDKGLNATELSRLADVDEQMLFFALAGLLDKKELVNDDFLDKICEVLDLDIQFKNDF